MLLTITNPSSPGASFTNNTNEVILLVSDWINEHYNYEMPFVDFRKAIQKDKGVNDNNNRNIFPLLKNSELVDYEKGELLAVNSFFTSRGKAYINALRLIKNIENNSSYSESQKNIAIKEANNIIYELIYESLILILGKDDINYRKYLHDLICFLLRFGKISKQEFALLLSTDNNLTINERLDSIEELVEKYRLGLLDIDVKVNVRNDIDLREVTRKDNRNEGIGFLTSYGYFINLLLQADLIYQNNKYYEINDDKYSKLNDLGGLYE